jgi:membrane peptidoglycan carboxypeptidase
MAADVDVWPSRSIPSFARRPAEGELPLELACGQHIDSVLGELGDSHVRLATLHSPHLAFASPQRSRGAGQEAQDQEAPPTGPHVALFVLAFSSFTFGLVTAVASEAPKCDPARQRHQVNTRIYDSTGHKILAVLRGTENRVLVDYDDISPLMKQAIIAIEDRRYFEHHGVDMRAIGRALWADLRQQGVVQGGSTITQQFIKNSCSDTGRTVGRKVREATLAWGLEQRWSKKKILTSYLNTCTGNGAYGVDQAARTYFGHRARR